jgi:CRISPR-associated protein Csx10
MTASFQPRSAFELVVTMESDWHVGTGAGRIGSVDRLAVRDRDGFPCLPAKTLTGIWRDACEQVAWGLDGAPGGDPPVADSEAPSWRRLVAVVFGDEPAVPGTAGRRYPAGPRPKALSVRSARLGPTLRAALDRPGLRDAVTYVRPSVRIDPWSGRAMDRHLRFTEVARAGCALRASDCRLELDLLEGEERAAAWALLVAGMRLVDHVGGGRRRGAGRCRWSVESVGEEDELAIVDWLSQAPPPKAPARRPKGRTGLAPLPAGEGGWLDFPLIVRLLDPVVAAARVLGNVTETLDHLPGRLLLPLIERACAGAGVDVRPAIARGDLRALPAYLEVGEERGRPVPFLARRAKGAGESGRLHLGGDTPGLKQVRKGYVGSWTGGEAIELAEVETALHMHNTVDDATQRPRDAGGVYSYEAIEAGTVLRGIVRVRESLAGRLGPCLRALVGVAEIGRSRKDDFGRVELEVGGPAAVPTARSGDGLWLWCLSDVLLEPRPHEVPLSPAALLVEAAGELLGARLQLHPETPPQVRVRRHDAWQTRWSMPRPSLVAIAAGSVVRLEPVPIDLSRAADGLGLRRAEGFGEIVLDDPLLFEREVDYRPPARRQRADGAQLAPVPAADLRFAELVEREAWRSTLRAMAIARGASDEFRGDSLHWKPGKPGRSQLGALRTMVRLRSPDREARLRRLTEVRNRRDKWTPGALDVLRDLFERPDAVWELLPEEGWPKVDEDRAGELRRELRDEALVLLVDEAARRHAREEEG